MNARETWHEQLATGAHEAAWDLFLDRYRRLLFGTIGRLVRGEDERMDAFTFVCGHLRNNDCRRLRAWRPEGPALFSTWLVTVTRNLVIDWIRSETGRPRLEPLLATLTPVQRIIFRHRIEGRRSYVEAYELMKAQGEFAEGFGSFLREVRELHRTANAAAGPLARELIGTDPTSELSGESAFIDESRPDALRAMGLLDTLPPDVKAATLLFVVEEVPAEDVARIVGWPNRKTVYNRVYRALELIRARLDGGGIEQDGAPEP